jgi:hypothetical protein
MDNQHFSVTKVIVIIVYINLNQNKMGYSEKGASTPTLWAIVNEKNEILFSRGGSSSTPKLLVYADETSARRGLSSSWTKQCIANNKIQIKLIYNL